MPTATMTRDGLQPNLFGWLPALAAFIGLECLVVLQALLAYQDRFFTVSQMRERGISQGLPFVWHFGMWGDFVLISALAAYLIGRYVAKWRPHSIFASLTIGFVSAGLLSWLYTLSVIPEAHVQNHQLTPAGWVHLIYMAIAVAVFVQFLFFSENVSTPLLLAVSALLIAHVFIGTHMALGIIALSYPFDWYPTQPLKSFSGWITFGLVGLGLAMRNLWNYTDVDS